MNEDEDPAQRQKRPTASDYGVVAPHGQTYKKDADGTFHLISSDNNNKIATKAKVTDQKGSKLNKAYRHDDDDPLPKYDILVVGHDERPTISGNEPVFDIIPDDNHITPNTRGDPLVSRIPAVERLNEHDKIGYTVPDSADDQVWQY